MRSPSALSVILHDAVLLAGTLGERTVASMDEIVTVVTCAIGRDFRKLIAAFS